MSADKQSASRFFGVIIHAALPALLLLTFSVSLFFGGYQDITYAPALFALLGAALVSLCAVKRTALIFPATLPALLLFGFWLFVTLSLSWSSVPFASLITWLIFLTMPLSFLSLCAAPGRDIALKLTALFLGGALCVLSLYALYQYGTQTGNYSGRAHLPLPNPNSLGGLLAMGIPPLVAFYFHHRKKTAFIALAAAFLILAGTFATGSRGAILALAIALCTLFFMLRHSGLTRGKLLPLLAGIVVIFGLMNIAGRTAMTDRIGDLATAPAQEPEVQHRLLLWDSAIEMIKDAPLLGRGLGTFYLTYPAYRHPGDLSMGNWAHMDSLQFGVEMGLIAPLLFYMFLGSVLWFTIRALRRCAAESAARYGIAGTFCGLLVIALQCHTTFHLYIMPILVSCGVLLAIWYQNAARVMPDKNFWFTLSLRGASKACFNTTLIIALMCIALVTASAAAGSYYTLKARDAIARSNVTAFIGYIEKARAYSPPSFIDPNVQIAGFYADIAHASIALHTPKEQEKLVDDVEALLNTAERQNPHWAEIDYKRGIFYSKIDPLIVPDGDEKAVQAWKSALRKNPMHHRALEKLATAYIEKGQVQKAYNILDQGLAFPAPQDFYDKLWVMREKLKPLRALQQNYKTQEKEQGQPRTTNNKSTTDESESHE